MQLTQWWVLGLLHLLCKLFLWEIESTNDQLGMTDKKIVRRGGWLPQDPPLVQVGTSPLHANVKEATAKPDPGFLMPHGQRHKASVQQAAAMWEGALAIAGGWGQRKAPFFPGTWSPLLGRYFRGRP